MGLTRNLSAEEILTQVWFALQAAFLAAALVFVRRHVVHVYKARLASYVIEYVGQLQKQKMEASPHRLVHSKSTLHGTRVGRTFSISAIFSA